MEQPFGFEYDSDSGISFQLLRGNASVPTTFDVGYLLAALLISAAAWDSGRHRIGRPSHGTVASPLEPVIPFAAMALALTGATARLFIHRTFAPVVQIFGIVILATSAIALLVHRHDVVQTLRRSRAAEAELMAAQLSLNGILAVAPVGLFSVAHSGVVELAEGQIADRLTSATGDLVGRPATDLLSLFPSGSAAPQAARAGR